jgi:hypothetical protein
MLGNRRRTDNSDDCEYTKTSFGFLSGRFLKVSSQGIVLVVKAIKIGSHEPRYSEVMKFYTEPDIIG